VSTGSGTGTPIAAAAEPAALVIAQSYSHLAEMLYDLDLHGLAATKEAKALDRIRAASVWLAGKAGRFIPVTESRRYDGPGGRRLFIDPLLAVTTLVDDTITLTASDYLLYPRARHWDNGPYTTIEIDPDASALAAWTHERDIVAVSGRWGKYEETADTLATVANTTSISASETGLKVSDGSKVSPGMILLIGTEQAQVDATGAHSAATSKLSAAITGLTDDVISVDTGSEFKVGEIIRVDSEDMHIEGINANALAVTRKWNETEAATHADDSAIEVYRTYTITRGVNGTTAAIHLNGVAISRYLPPWDVNWIVREIAGLMYKKARGGFAGKSANAELGEVFYHDEFPKRQVDEVIKNYRLVSI
jgi:hypothetical protein